ncbi:MAG: EpsG family protein, partial [Kiritimatiellae bacterium]|nr:EpsG family protein [Kiritimatiellia bacterium]
MEGKIIFGFIFTICLFYLCKFYRINGFRAATLTEQQELVWNRRVVWHLSILLFLLGALRNMHTGTDTIFYCMKYEGIGFEHTLTTLWQEALSSPLAERGYYLVAKYFSFLFPSAQVWLAFLCLLFLLPCTILIYKYSALPPLSFTYLLAMPIYIFVWQGLRQAISMSICLIAFFFAKEKKWWKFLALLFLAFQFHRSAIVFLMVIPAMYFKADRKLYVGIFAAVFLALFNPLSINSFLMSHLGMVDKVNLYASNTNVNAVYKMFLLLLFLFVISFMVRKELIQKNKLNQQFLIFSAIGVVLQLFSIVILEFFRVSFYFSIF